jgi:hypothetical protein
LARHQYLDAITEHLTQGVFHALQVTLAPALGIIVVIVGVFEVPVVYAIAASALTFAAAATGLLRYGEWMQGIRINDRLTFTRITQATDVDFSSGAPILKTAQYQILFYNNARFPLCLPSITYTQVWKIKRANLLVPTLRTDLYRPGQSDCLLQRRSRSINPSKRE